MAPTIHTIAATEPEKSDASDRDDSGDSSSRGPGSYAHTHDSSGLTNTNLDNEALFTKKEFETVFTESQLRWSAALQAPRAMPIGHYLAHTLHPKPSFPEPRVSADQLGTFRLYRGPSDMEGLKFFLRA